MTGTGTAIAPFLLDIARDLETDLAAVANLIAIMSVTWGLTSLVAGAASDRVGRRPILAAGVVILGSARLAFALAGSFAWALTWQLLAGVGGGAYMGTVLAAVSDRMPPSERGRALGWVITGQSLSLVFGVPLVTLLATAGGWRGALLAQGAAALVAVPAVWLAVPPARAPTATAARSGIALATLVDLRVLALLGASTMERACFAAMAVYLATYLLTSYGVSLPVLSAALALVALGNLAGNLAGGQLADRLPNRVLAHVATALATALLAMPLLAWRPGLGLSIGLGFAYALVNAAGRPPLIAALSEVPSQVRGAVLGLNIASGSLGWLGAGALGGHIVTRAGFGGLGLFCVGAALAGAGLAGLAWRLARRGPRI